MVFITNLNQILKAIKHNVYSKALTHYLYHHVDDRDIKGYLGLLTERIEGIPDDKLHQIDRLDRRCGNVGIHYLLLVYKLGLARYKGSETVCRKLYKKLLREYDHIPQSCRKGVARELKIHSAYHKADGLKAFRTWSEKHLEDAYDQTFDTLQNTLKLFSLEADNTAEAFYNTFQEALTHQQQDLLLTSLNNSTWGLRHINLKKSVEMAQELGYYSGYYAEESQAILSGLDTQLRIAKLNDDYESFYEYARLMNRYYERYARPYPNLRQTYQSSIRFARQYALVQKKQRLKRDEIANGKAVRRFLKEQIRKPNAFAEQTGISHASLYRILNGERHVIKIGTVKAIVRALNLDYSFSQPRDINYVLWCMKADSLFEANREKIRKLSDEALGWRLIRGAFVAPLNGDVNVHKLFSLITDREAFLCYVERNIQMKVFINRCFNDTFPFYRGRAALLDKLTALSPLKEKQLTLYSGIEMNTDLERMSTFFRSYTLGMTIRVDFELEEMLQDRFNDPDYAHIAAFCERMQLSEIDGYLCTWFFGKEERKRLIEQFF